MVHASRNAVPASRTLDWMLTTAWCHWLAMDDSSDALVVSQARWHTGALPLACGTQVERYSSWLSPSNPKLEYSKSTVVEKDASCCIVSTVTGAHTKKQTSRQVQVRLEAFATTVLQLCIRGKAEVALCYKTFMFPVHLQTQGRGTGAQAQVFLLLTRTISATMPDKVNAWDAIS